MQGYLKFQFTHPGKGATCTSPMRVSPRECFNSRTLGRVRLYLLYELSALSDVSIHAPWEGCDFIYDYKDFDLTRFNSRTLGRVRLANATAIGLGLVFQFTHPGKGATFSLICTLYSLSLFQFTHPGKGATWSELAGKSQMGVSIHAPWEGCDPPTNFSSSKYQLMFQFTHPGKGATLKPIPWCSASTVSIHAPWEGCDSVVQSCVL